MKTVVPAEQELIDHRRPGGKALPPELSHLKALAALMDSLFEIPGLRVKFGLDALLGLFPGVGDLLASLVSLYILHTAGQQGVSRITMARMGTNILLEYVVGSRSVCRGCV